MLVLIERKGYYLDTWILWTRIEGLGLQSILIVHVRDKNNQPDGTIPVIRFPGSSSRVVIGVRFYDRIDSTILHLAWRNFNCKKRNEDRIDRTNSANDRDYTHG